MNLREHLRTIQQRWPHLQSPSDDDPIFVLAAGWRSGSTLLQRMLMRHCFIWGEPFGRAMPIDSIAQQLTVFNNGWPAESVFANPSRVQTVDLAKQWVANLYPPMESLLEAHIAYFAAMFRVPAARLGYRRWGLKEVRLSADHAAYLRWLYPRARIVLLYRDPYACYHSFRALRITYVRWPDQAIDSPERFGNHWSLLMEGYLQSVDAIGAFLLKYEDLCSPQFDAGPLSRYVGCELDLAARATKVGASPKQIVSADEWDRLRKTVEPIAAQLGYQPPVP